MSSGNGSRLGASPDNPTLSYSVPLGRVPARRQTRDMPSALEQSLHRLKIAVTQLQARFSAAHTGVESGSVIRWTDCMSLDGERFSLI